ncbi:MAG: FAD-binding oxidoreductase [Proteobacteria bacterium]|nr:MAG: FAD-binding oxidoreductase [Pseudomonadota bacterium]
MSAPLAFESQSTWYEAQAKRQPIQEPLSGSVETDVCIVGAGLAGLFLAKELTERHRSALIFEARRIGAGASGRHGGFCSPGWACRGPQIEERVGLVKAKALFNLSREGYQMVKDVLTTADVTCTSGILHPSTYSNADGLLRMLERMDKDFGYQLEFLETDTVKDLLDTPKYYQAWRDPKGFHFDALALCLLLREALQKRGYRSMKKP